MSLVKCSLCKSVFVEADFNNHYCMRLHQRWQKLFPIYLDGSIIRMHLGFYENNEIIPNWVNQSWKKRYPIKIEC